MKDRFEHMFDLRIQFMEALREKIPDASPELPIDLTNKEHQQVCRDIALKGVEEMFEALQHLKNWKPHRVKDIPEFDSESFLEEVVDAFNYFFSLLVLTGVGSDELFSAYEKKDKIIRDRIDSGY